MAETPYTMNISLNVLEHLGIGLYSNIPAVLSEAVANAWDADATRADITTSEGEIVIQDDGTGMSVDDANKKYLHVGYDRRGTEGGESPSGRPVIRGCKCGPRTGAADIRPHRRKIGDRTRPAQRAGPGAAHTPRLIVKNARRTGKF